MSGYFGRLKEKHLSIFQFSKYIIVGTINTAIDLGALNLLICVSHKSSGIYYPIFKSISFLMAVTNSYFLNKRWTFGLAGEASAGEFLKFTGVNLIGWGINVGVATYVVNVIGAPTGFSPVLWANIGAISAIVITLFWNFFGIKFFVFKKKPPAV